MSSPLSASAQLKRRASSSGDLEPVPPPVHLGRLAALTGLYSLAEGLVTYPYELVKTRQQAAPAGHASRTTPTIEYMLRVNRENGPRALYRGFGWNVFGGIPSEAAHYVAYHQTKVWMLQTRTGARNPSLVYVAAGTLAEIVSVGLWVPFDVISQRLQLQGTQRAAAAAAAAAAAVPAAAAESSAAVPAAAAASAPMPATGPTGIQVARRIIETEGVVGLWRGSGATMAALAPFSAVWWWTHEQAKAAMVRRLGWNAEGYAVLSASGTLAAVAATVATNPLDVLKTRIQCRDEPAAIGTVLRGLLNEAGWGGLYSGILPRLLSAVPRSVCTVLVYERALLWCRREDG